MCLAIPGKVETITGDDPLTRTGKVNFGGILKEASLAYVFFEDRCADGFEEIEDPAFPPPAGNSCT